MRIWKPNPQNKIMPFTKKNNKVPLWPKSTSDTSVQVSKNEIYCYLIFVKLTVLEGGLALRLEGHDDEADEDVHHEEGDDDDVDEVEKRDIGTIVVNWTMVDFVGVDGHV